MAIDTENKRRSCLSHRIPGLGIRPYPDGEISKPDRRHSGLYYAGVDSQYIPSTFWIKDFDAPDSNWNQINDSSTQWTQSGNTESHTWVSINDSSESWVKNSRTSSSWVKQLETEDE